MSKSELGFTDAQKEAVIYGLYQIARGDDDLDDAEIDFLKRVGEQLGEVFDHLSVSKLIVKHSSHQIKELIQLTLEQKKWFVIASYTLINSDERLFNGEFTVANGFFRAMGISEEEAIEYISKVNGISYY